MFTLVFYQKQVVGLAGGVFVQTTFTGVKWGEERAQMCDGIQIRKSVDLKIMFLPGCLLFLSQNFLFCLGNSLSERSDQIERIIGGLPSIVFIL